MNSVVLMAKRRVVASVTESEDHSLSPSLEQMIQVALLPLSFGMCKEKS